MPREVKKLRVKAEPLNGLLLEQDPAPLAAKSLESALCVHKRQAQDDAHDFVEDDAGKLAEERLVHLDQAAVHGARADGHVMRLQSREKFLRLLDRRGQVRIGEQNGVASRFERAEAHAITFSAVNAIRQGA